MPIERVLKGMARACTALGALSLAVMMLSTDYDVVARATLDRPLNGAVDIVEMMVLCVAFLGLPEVCLRDEQIRVDIVDGLISSRALLLLKILGLALTVVFMAILAANVVPPMLDAYRFGDIKPDTGFPVYPLFGLTLFSLLAAMVTTVAVLVRLLRPGSVPST